MKTKARIQFVGDDDEYTQEATRKLFSFLQQTKLYAFVGISESDPEDYVDISFGQWDVKSQLHWLAVILSDWRNWHFVGQTCPNAYSLTKHRLERRNLHSINHPTRGEQWVCQELKCRVHVGLSPDDYMTLMDFRMASQIACNEPGLIAVVPPLPHTWQPRMPPRVRQDVETVTGRLSSNTKSGLPRNMERSSLIEYSSLSESDARIAIESLYKQFPALKQWHEMSALNKLTVEKERLEIDLKDEKESLDNAHQVVRVLHEDIRKLKEGPKPKPVTPGLVAAADSMLQFLAGLNMQDHSIKDQQEFINKFRILKGALIDSKTKCS